MNKRSLATIYGAIKVVPSVDCIGVPVFRNPGMNFDLIPEMDDDLRIVRFMDFYNEDGYHLEEYPTSYKGKRIYSIGDPSPISFWVNGSLAVIEGDRYPEDVADLIKDANGSKVLTDIAALLRDARSGFFRERTKRWLANEVKRGFGDVLEGRPINSRYWITRYQAAVSTILKRAPEPQDDLISDLRRLAISWLGAFGTKSDMKKIDLLLRNLDSHVMSRREAQDNIFAALIHKVAIGNVKDVYSFIVKNSVEFFSLYPGGLYEYYLENGFPKVSFSYKHDIDMIAIMKRSLQFSVAGAASKKARELSTILFGLRDAPAQLQEPLSILRRRLSNHYNEAKGRFSELMYQYERHGEESDYISARDAACEVVITFDALVEVEHIEYGNHRTGMKPSGWIEEEMVYVNDLKRRHIQNS